MAKLYTFGGYTINLKPKNEREIDIEVESDIAVYETNDWQLKNISVKVRLCVM